MPRRKRQEEHVNHEAWAIPFGDLLTLLLAFFVVMYAISSVNEGKYRVLADVLSAEFRGKPTTVSPVQVGDQSLGPNSNKNAAAIQMPFERASNSTSAVNSSNQSEQGAAESTGKKVLDQVADSVELAMSNLIHDKLVSIRRHDLWIEIDLQTDFLYSSGSASLSAVAVGVLEPLAASLRPYKNAIRVEGHTDNVPINTLAFKSNWELSAARAASVVHLFSDRGVDPARLTVIGYGEYRPHASNATLEGRNTNRRVVLVILNEDKGINGDSTKADSATESTP
jgi:chemotaxis protein MotB